MARVSGSVSEDEYADLDDYYDSCCEYNTGSADGDAYFAPSWGRIGWVSRAVCGVTHQPVRTQADTLEDGLERRPAARAESVACGVRAERIRLRGLRPEPSSAAVLPLGPPPGHGKSGIFVDHHRRSGL